MTPKQKIASEYNWQKLIVDGAIGNIRHVLHRTSDDYAFKLVQRIEKDLKKLSILVEIERDKKLAEIKNDTHS